MDDLSLRKNSFVRSVELCALDACLDLQVVSK